MSTVFLFFFGFHWYWGRRDWKERCNDICICPESNQECYMMCLLTSFSLHIPPVVFQSSDTWGSQIYVSIFLLFFLSLFFFKNNIAEKLHPHCSIFSIVLGWRQKSQRQISQKLEVRENLDMLFFQIVVYVLAIKLVLWNFVDLAFYIR